jgi:hypothetical protein
MFLADRESNERWTFGRTSTVSSGGCHCPNRPPKSNHERCLYKYASSARRRQQTPYSSTHVPRTREVRSSINHGRGKYVRSREWVDYRSRKRLSRPLTILRRSTKHPSTHILELRLLRKHWPSTSFHYLKLSVSTLRVVQPSESCTSNSYHSLSTKNPRCSDLECHQSDRVRRVLHWKHNSSTDYTTSSKSIFHLKGCS